MRQTSNLLISITMLVLAQTSLSWGYSGQAVVYEFHDDSPVAELPFMNLPTATSDCVSVQVMVFGDFGSSQNYCTARFGSNAAGWTFINANTVRDMYGQPGMNIPSAVPADGKLLRLDGDTQCIEGSWSTLIFQIPSDTFNNRLQNGNIQFQFMLPYGTGPVLRICDACANFTCCLAENVDTKTPACVSLSMVRVTLLYNPASYSYCPECTSDGDCDDGLYCNGAETCVDGNCVAGSNPCPGDYCRESNDTCVECLNDGHCNDGNPCATGRMGQIHHCERGVRPVGWIASQVRNGAQRTCGEA